MDRARLSADELRRSFWAPSAAAVAAGMAIGLASADAGAWIDVRVPLLDEIDADSARSLLETIATAMLSVGGVAFSVTVVALQMASSQLNPRVLRTFQADRLSKLTLATFLGVFALCIATIVRLPSQGRASDVAVALAVVAAIAGLLLFAAFIHHIVIMLQAATLIHRVALEGREAIAGRWPVHAGEDAGDGDLGPATRDRRPVVVEAPRAGYLQSIDGASLLEALGEADAMARQRAPIGDFVVSGMPLAELWPPPGMPDDDVAALRDAVEATFRFGRERSPVEDVAFPLRQLADVALRALSPSVNDPTTAEDALGSIAELLVELAAAPATGRLRAEPSDRPRLEALVPELDDLVRLGFDQVRVAAAEHPVVAARVAILLHEVARAADRNGIAADEPARQLRLLEEGVDGRVPTGADAAVVRRAVDDAR